MIGTTLAGAVVGEDVSSSKGEGEVVSEVYVPLLSALGGAIIGSLASVASVYASR